MDEGAVFAFEIAGVVPLRFVIEANLQMFAGDVFVGGLDGQGVVPADDVVSSAQGEVVALAVPGDNDSLGNL